MITRILNQPYVKPTVILLIVDGCLALLTNPKQAPAWLLILAYGLVVATGYVTVGLISGIFGTKLLHRQQFRVLITLVLAIVVGMASLGQLSMKDLLVLLALSLITGFYLSYTRSSTSVS